MNKEMQDLSAWAIKTAKAGGANDCKVSIGSRRNVEISYRQHKPENIKEATTRQLFIQVYVNGRYSSQTTSDLRKDALKDFIENAVAATKLLAEDPYRSLPDPKYYQDRKEIDLELFDPEYQTFSPEDRHGLVKAMENAALEKGGDKVISVTAEENDGHSEAVTMTSNGFEGYEEDTFYVAAVEMTIQDEGDRRPNGGYYAVTLNRKDLPQPGKIGAECARRTLNLLGAKKIKTETLPIIIQNQGVARIFGGFYQAMGGRSIQQKQSFLADQKGKQVGSRHFTVIDDPFVKRGLGSRLFDADGFAAKKRVMIDKGILQDYYVDWYYSRKLEREPTTGGPTNLIVPPGTRSVETIMKDLGRGILITGFIGGNSNATTGDMSIGIIGQLFEGGQPVQAVSEMNISDNHMKFWKKLIEVADDPYPYSSMRFPSMVFTDIVVSGL